MGREVLAEQGAADVEALRAVPAEKLVNTGYSYNSMTVDGYAITEQPWLTYEKGENNEEALLNGFNGHEADLFNYFLRVSADGVGIYLTHGHRQNVKMTLDALANTVHFSGARLGLFGHTHCSEYKKMGDVVLFNPGSVGRGRRSYGLITVKGTEFQCKLMDA